jgi:hypothetical protein
VTFERAAPGRRVGRTCRRPAPNLRGHAGCTRYVLAGTLTRRALVPGAQQIAFSGRLGLRPLALGFYRLTVLATDQAGNHSMPHRLSFVIVAR